jgi:hypothetical protein
MNKQNASSHCGSTIFAVKRADQVNMRLHTFGSGFLPNGPLGTICRASKYQLHFQSTSANTCKGTDEAVKALDLVYSTEKQQIL